MEDGHPNLLHARYGYLMHCFGAIIEDLHTLLSTTEFDTGAGIPQLSHRNITQSKRTWPGAAIFRVRESRPAVTTRIVPTDHHPLRSNDFCRKLGASPARLVSESLLRAGEEARRLLSKTDPKAPGPPQKTTPPLKAWGTAKVRTLMENAREHPENSINV
ncbi:hypothetical protein CSAL01_07753 [Colletotrichum salicis]|uniref:Uncharacterized protein n=1 Tax=Colletotrichum salicis TaxID=1209931 RepID=A0A135TIN2_9PEZI|nr:hypothetical protein CSAL01_07753 [Colletotrichum salicis]